MDRLLEQYKEKSLSDHDIMRIAEGKTNILSYQDLTHFKNIYDALGPYKSLVILYETESGYGHWVCLFENDDSSIQFFDSYGYEPDAELKFVPKYFRKQSNQELPHLTALLYNSNCF